MSPFEIIFIQTRLVAFTVHLNIDWQSCWSKDALLVISEKKETFSGMGLEKATVLTGEGKKKGLSKT